MDAHLLVRWLHVTAATLIGGGALLTAVVSCTGGLESRQRVHVVLLVARRYECVFWTAFGVIVATGVGNLGVLGEGLPGPHTEWGGVLTLKLAAVLLLAAGSGVRTLIVAGMHETDAERAVSILRASYLVTAVFALAVVGAAEVLAHG